MANTSSAKKAAKQNEKRRVRNLARRTSIKTALKKAVIAIDGKELNFVDADALIRDVAAKLARARGKGVIHPNTAARKLSRITKRLRKRTHAEV
jgi:small subunit ribosomal protein S20